MILSKERITKALIRLHGCAGWSVLLLFANQKIGFLTPFQRANNKGLIRLHICAGWSALLLFANPEDRFSRVEAHFILWFIIRENFVFQAGRNCQQCELPCQFDRPEGCTHRCPQPCHSGPCPPCTLMFRMRCHCQAIVQHIECYKWLNASEQQKNKLRSCGGSCPKQVSIVTVFLVKPSNLQKPIFLCQLPQKKYIVERLVEIFMANVVFWYL